MADQVFNTNAEKEASKAVSYAEFGKLNLSYIREGIANILKLIGRDGIFHEHTLHDMTHIDAMLELLDIIIPPETMKIMTPADWLLIVLGCYFHDLGLLVTKKEYENRHKSGFAQFLSEILLKGDTGIDYKASISNLTEDEIEKFYYQEFVRHNHAERVYYWVTGKANEKLGASHQAVSAINTLLDGLDEKLRRDLALICRSHHSDDLDQIDTVYVLRRAYGQKPQTYANLQYSALLLRSVDLLQIQRNRVPAIMYKLIDPSNPKSQDEWAKQSGVRAILPSKTKSTSDQVYDTIEVQAEFKEASGFFGLIAYLHYAQSEIKQSAEWAELARAKGSKYAFPWRYINDNQVEAIGFLPQKYQFTLDREKILNLLTGHTLYNDTSVAVREILQNSIDAVRFRKYNNPEEPLGKVQVKWDTAKRTLIIEDNGVGMTRHTIENHLLNVGSSYYQDRKFKERYPDFSPISRFGIGVLSYFMISNDIEITTVHEEEETAYQLTLPSATQRYLIKLLPKDHENITILGSHGTRVSLIVRPSAKLEDIDKILRYWIVIPRCPILLTIDDGEPKRIGFSSSSEALEYYVRQQIGNEQEKDTIIKRPEPKDGLDLAYTVHFSRWFKVWNILSRGGRSIHRFEDIFRNIYSMPPGICVEGIRISSDPPGYNSNGVWTLADLSGLNSPKTNVARSNLEYSPELKVTQRRVYQTLGNHISEEFKRLIDSGYGTTKASLEADFMTDDLIYGVVDLEEAKKCIDSLPIFIVEDNSGRKIVSREELRRFSSIWTADGPIINHLDGITESIQTTHTSNEIIHFIGSEDKFHIHLPRIIGKRMSALEGMEVASILIDEKNLCVSMEWKTKADRWHIIEREYFKTEKESGIESWRIREICGSVIAIANSSIQCDNPTISWLKVRDMSLFLEKSSISILWNLFKGSSRCWEWIGHLINYHNIRKRSKLSFQQDLKAIGCDPEEILPQMIIREEEIFEPDRFARY